MMAACRNVETYAAAQVSHSSHPTALFLINAQVFYWVGFNGMAYVLDVFSKFPTQFRLLNEYANSKQWQTHQA
jgi:hypothetical protein